MYESLSLLSISTMLLFYPHKNPAPKLTVTGIIFGPKNPESANDASIYTVTQTNHQNQS